MVELKGGEFAIDGLQQSVMVIGRGSQRRKVWPEIVGCGWRWCRREEGMTIYVQNKGNHLVLAL